MSVKKKSEFSKQPTGDKILLIIAYAILGLFLLAIIFPVIYIILSSFIDPITLQNKGLTFDFSKWTLTAYERVMGNAQIWVGFKNALIYSIASTILSGVITLLAAYPMSRSDPHLPADQRHRLAGQSPGHPGARCLQRVEHDHRPHLLSGHSPGPPGSGGHRRRH